MTQRETCTCTCRLCSTRHDQNGNLKLSNDIYFKFKLYLVLYLGTVLVVLDILIKPTLEIISMFTWPQVQQNTVFPLNASWISIPRVDIKPATDSRKMLLLLGLLFENWPDESGPYYLHLWRLCNHWCVSIRPPVCLPVCSLVKSVTKKNTDVFPSHFHTLWNYVSKTGD